VIRFLILLHLIGLVLGMGGLVCQVWLLARYHDSTRAGERAGSESGARSIIFIVQTPGIYLSILSGLGLLWSFHWQMLSQGWLQFKLLFVFWLWLATLLMGRNADKFLTLRDQCGENDSERLRSLKGNHRMIGYVTIFTFIFVMLFSLYKPF
jgi:uncharacterized membrane protein